jgi:predicted patatin/cPLA2 family phospholipase
MKKHIKIKGVLAVGLALEGGGMRAGFVAGVLMALFDKNLADFSGDIPGSEKDACYVNRED